MNNFKNKNFCCFGDSITSNMVTGIGSRICEILDAKMFGNFAVGYATACDFHNQGINSSYDYLLEPENEYAPVNCLSNQIKRAVALSQAKKLQPEIAYIAAGINDGKDESTGVYDDFDIACKIPLSDNKRVSFAQSLLWAIQTLKQEFKGIDIYVASPLFTASENIWMQNNAVLLKREIIKKICAFENVHFIDSTYISGFTNEIALSNGDTVHPKNENKEMVAINVANEMMNLQSAC